MKKINEVERNKAENRQLRYEYTTKWKCGRFFSLRKLKAVEGR
jgi:ribosomal protein L13E